MTTINDKVTLYIATHNKTGLKYFGKTIKYFTKEELQKNYHGSGKHWTNHLKKHGDNVTMEIYGIFSLNENDIDYVAPIALKFSEENNIVKSKEWANAIPENGLGGGVKGIKFSEEHKKNIGKSSKKRFENIKNNNLQNSINALRYWEYKSEEELRIINSKKSQKGNSNGMYGVKRDGELSPKYGMISITKNGKNKSIYPENLLKFESEGWVKGITQKKSKCKFCGVEMLCFHITRYHNDNCPHNPNEVPKSPKLSKKNYNTLKRLYIKDEGNYKKGIMKKFPVFPSSGKPTKALILLFEKYNINMFN